MSRSIICKRCGSECFVKNGWVRNQQRYWCKACQYNFTNTPIRGLPLTQKVKSIVLYISGLSMRRTAKLIGVSASTIQEWIEEFATVFADKPKPTRRAIVIELDEMWHYVKKVQQAVGLESL